MPRYYRKVIHIRAEDSPSVRLGLAQRAAGEEPTGEVLIPGVLPWHDYCKRRATWDPIRQCIGLDGEFYEGGDVLLFPPTWLNRAEQLYRDLCGTRRYAISIGVDTAEGGDETAMVAIDHYGIVEITSRRTPNTNVICGEVIAFARKHGVPMEQVAFDRGGGGKVHADRLRAQGHMVRTIGFGEAASAPPHRFRDTFTQRVGEMEQRYVYLNRRAEMYHLLHLQLDPDLNPRGFAIPPDETELRLELSVMPKLYDDEGRLYMLPKGRKDLEDTASGRRKDTLIDLIGHSPDRSDALVLAVFNAYGHVPEPTATLL